MVCPLSMPSKPPSSRSLKAFQQRAMAALTPIEISVISQKIAEAYAAYVKYGKMYSAALNAKKPDAILNKVIYLRDASKATLDGLKKQLAQ